MNPTRNDEVSGLIPGLDPWVKNSALLFCGVGRRCGLDLTLLWLWCRPAAVAPIGPLAWESPYAVGVAIKRQKDKKKKKKKTQKSMDFASFTAEFQFIEQHLVPSGYAITT